MNKFLKKSRIVIIFVIMAVLLSVYASALYELQIVNGEKYLEESANSIVSRSTVVASRGNILDRNGVLLVSSTTVYNVMISRSKLLEQEDPNEVLLRLVYAAIDNDVSYIDTFPVTISPAFSYVGDMTSTQQSRLSAYLDYFNLDENISASDLIVWLKDHYGIDYTTSLSDARLIIGVRYELELRAILNIPDYVFAEDIDIDFITAILENDFPGVSLATTSKRIYHTEYAAHILGYTGLMTQEEYAVYKDLDYPMNAVVGKSGVELAFEEYLHGTDGAVTITTNSSGATTSVLTTEEAVSGQNVYLTIDIGLQGVAEESLADTIATLNAERTDEEEKIDGGAVVVIDVNSGGTLACASYPSYNLSTFNSDYSQLAADALNPLFNRATLGTYNPGSTFKMVTAYAGLCGGTISRSTLVEDKGIYTAYQDFQPRCWIYPGSHGTLSVVGALENSCNYFFYWLSDNIGIDAISSAAAKFGLGSKTGIEIPEAEGTIATPEYKEKYLDEGWWAADTLLAAIGQGHNYFTPIQLANYVSTIANGGTLYSVSLLKYVASSDYTSILYSKEPAVVSALNDGASYVSILQEGMKAVAESGTASSVFGDYPIAIAAKTGTVQSDTASANTGVFVCYAPADDPEIAIAVVVEKGGSGSAIMAAAKDILDYYFSEYTYEDVVPADNSLIK